MTRPANRANTTIYTIDPRGLVGDGGHRRAGGSDSSGTNYVRKSQDSMRVLAEETGGIAVVNKNDFDKALKRIDAETSDYYVLGYYSSNPDPHEAPARDRREGRRARARRSWFAQGIRAQAEPEAGDATTKYAKAAGRKP